jgi:hypothetical protein
MKAIKQIFHSLFLKLFNYFIDDYDEAQEKEAVYNYA